MSDGREVVVAATFPTLAGMGDPGERAPQREVFTRWGTALVVTLLALLIVSVPLGWFAAYHGRSLTEIFSFVVQDGWCDAATQGVGMHCFGDYYAPVAFVNEGNPWNNAYGVPIAYTATGMLPFVLGALAAKTAVGGFPLLVGFLVVTGVAALTPALLTAWGRRSWTDRLLVVLLIGVATTPLLTTVDRGSGAAWAVPFLVMFVVWLKRDPWWVAPAGLVAAAAVRPQFLFAGVALLAVRRFRDLALALAAGVTMLLIGFAMWPGGFRENLDAWWRNTGLHEGVRNGDGVSPPSLSFSRVVVAIEDALGRGADGLAASNATVPGIVLVVVVAAVFIWRGPDIPYPVMVVTALALTALVPPLTFAYYGIFVPVIAALIIGGFRVPTGRRSRDRVAPMLDQPCPPPRRWRWWSLLVLAATALTLAPIPVAAAFERRSWILENVGVLWALVVISGLLLVASPGPGRLWGAGPDDPAEAASQQ